LAAVTVADACGVVNVSTADETQRPKAFLPCLPVDDVVLQAYPVLVLTEMHRVGEAGCLNPALVECSGEDLPPVAVPAEDVRHGPTEGE
jgi:hypothetical protein